MSKFQIEKHKGIFFIIVSLVAILVFMTFMPVAESSLTQFLPFAFVLVTLLTVFIFAIRRKKDSIIVLWRLLSLSLISSLFMYAVGLAALIFYGSSQFEDLIIAVIFFKLIVAILLIYFSFLVAAFLAWYIGALIRKKLMRISDNQLIGITPFIDILLGISGILYLYYLLSLARILWLGPIILTVILAIGVWHKRNLVISLSRRTWTLRNNFKGSLKYTALYGAVLFGGAAIIITYLKDPLYLNDWRNYMNLPLTFLQNGGYTHFRFDLLNQAPMAGTYYLLPILQLVPSLTFLLNSIFLLMLAFLLGIFTKRIFGEYAGFLVGLLFILLHHHIFFLSSARPGVLVSLITTVVIILLIDAEYMKHRNNLILAGFLIGLGIALKYTILFFVPAVIIATLPQPFSLKGFVKKLMIIGCSAIIAYSPWGLFNMYHYNNPLHPFTMRPATVYSTLTSSMTSINTGAGEGYSAAFGALRDDYEQKMLGFSSSETFFKKVITFSFAPKGWSSTHIYGPYLILSLLAAGLMFRIRLVRLLISMIIVTFFAWHVSGANQLHYIYYVLPMLTFVIGLQLAKIRRRMLVGYLFLLITIIFLVQYRSTDRFSTSIVHLTANERLIRNAMSSYTAQATYLGELIDTFYEANPYYRVFLMTSVNLTKITNNHDHILFDAYLQNWQGLTLDDPDGEILKKRLEERKITHLVLTSNAFNAELFTHCSSEICLTRRKMIHALDRLKPFIHTLQSGVIEIYEIK